MKLALFLVICLLGGMWLASGVDLMLTQHPYLPLKDAVKNVFLGILVCLGTLVALWGAWRIFK